MEIDNEEEANNRIKDEEREGEDHHPFNQEEKKRNDNKRESERMETEAFMQEIADLL